MSSVWKVLKNGKLFQLPHTEHIKIFIGLQCSGNI
jgi:hypothetical protein